MDIWVELFKDIIFFVIGATAGYAYARVRIREKRGE